MMIPTTQELLDFTNRTVIVTGASQGIGAGIARRFGEAGANVVVHYRGSQSGANELVNQITEREGKAVAAQADLSNEDACASLITRAIDTFGGLHVLVNNAGIFPNKALLEMTIKACKKQGKYVGICGQGPSDYPDFARWLLDQGIESMSLNPDTVVETWLFLAGESV